LQRRERIPEYARWAGANCKMHMQMQHLLELLHYGFLPHFADAAPDRATAVDSLSRQPHGAAPRSPPARPHAASPPLLPFPASGSTRGALRTTALTLAAGRAPGRDPVRLRHQLRSRLKGPRNLTPAASTAMPSPSSPTSCRSRERRAGERHGRD
jgi:hypothetical protein